MRKFMVIFLLMVLILIGVTPALASKPGYGFEDGFGVRALGMAGAFTAVADDGSAAYWNPAGITQVRFSLIGEFGVKGPEGDFQPPVIYETPGLLGITTKNCALNLWFNLYQKDFQTLLELINSSVYDYDLSVTLATPLNDYIAIGGNVKLLNVIVVEGEGVPFGSAVAMDIGVLIKPFKSDLLRLGFSGRNVNSPQLYLPSGSDFTLSLYPIQPSYNFGLALKPLKSTTLAFDYQAGDQVNPYHIGLEQKLLWNIIALRAGVKLNTLKVNLYDPFLFSLGLGLKLGPLCADLAVGDLNSQFPNLNFGDTAFSMEIRF